MTTSSSQPKLRPTPWDALVVLAVLALAAAVVVAFYGGKAGGRLTAVVTDHGTQVARVALDTLSAPKTIEVEGDYPLTVAVTGDGVYVSHADCPTQDCVHTGVITRAGQSIVCLPAQVVIHLEGGGDAPDVIVG